MCCTVALPSCVFESCFGEMQVGLMKFKVLQPTIKKACKCSPQES